MHRRLVIPGILLAAGSFLAGIAADRLLVGSRGGGAVTWRSADQAGAASGAPGSGARSDDAVRGASGQDRGGDERSVEEDAFRDAVRFATEETIGGLVASLRSRVGGDGSGHDRLMHAFRRWSELDPGAALAAALGETDRRLREAALHTVFQAVAERDLGAAQALLASVSDPDLRREAIHAMIDSGGRRSPAAFARFLEALPDGREFPWFFREWAEAEPGAAAAFVLSVGDHAKRAEWIRGVASGWAERDSAGAMTWLQGLAGTAEFWPAAETVVDETARRDPAAAAAFVQGLPAGHRRRELMDRVSGEWARQDLEGAVAWAESLDGPRGVAGMGPLLHEWARIDPQGAAAYLSRLPVSERTLDAAREVAERWGGTDPEAALAWALEQRDPGLRSRALGGALAAWADRDAASAAELATHFAPGDELRDAVRAVGRRWAEQDLGAAIGWLDRLPPDLRAEGSREVLDHLAHEDPRIAAAYWEVLASPGSDGESPSTDAFIDMAGEIAARWSEFTPGDAANWATNLPASEAGRRAVEEVAERWTRADPVGASEWISGLPPGPTRDAAAERLVDQISRSDPEAAFQWALSVGGAEHRADLARHVYHRWSELDPAAAQAALEGSSLAPDIRSEIEVPRE